VLQRHYNCGRLSLTWVPAQFHPLQEEMPEVQEL